MLSLLLTMTLEPFHVTPEVVFLPTWGNLSECTWRPHGSPVPAAPCIPPFLSSPFSTKILFVSSPHSLVSNYGNAAESVAYRLPKAIIISPPVYVHVRPVINQYYFMATFVKTLIKLVSNQCYILALEWGSTVFTFLYCYYYIFGHF